MNYNKLFDLEKQLGDSYYILDSGRFKNNHNDFIQEFRSIYPKTHIGYSYKTNYLPKLCRIIRDMNEYAEVVSKMEYDLAIKIGMDPSKIIVNGPYKLFEDIEIMALKGSQINIDSWNDLEHIISISEKNSEKKINVALRCNLDMEDSDISRFGFDVTDEKFLAIPNTLKKFNNISLNGIHCHLPNRNIESFEKRTKKILEVSDKLFSSPPEYISVGGGFFGNMPKKLTDQFNSKVVGYKEYAAVIASQFYNHYINIEFNKKPMLFLEPGTALVADTMKFVVKVIDLKNIRGHYIATTSGSKFNIGAFSSKLNMPITVYTKELINRKYYHSVDICGYTCIENDILYKRFEGYLNVNDYIVFENVGSYSFLFKPPFILPNVAIIDYNFNSGRFNVLKKRETFNNIFETFNFEII